jgi:thiol-disulfide isomerase/thioredoxin
MIRRTATMRAAAAIPALLAVVAGCATVPTPAAAPRFGDPVPEFRVGEWVKGEPVARIEGGRVYFIEMWATWCGPCRAALPHVSELARRHRDDGVVFIGINVMDPDLESVRAFVAKAGALMDYPVAIDAASDGADAGLMATAWLAEDQTIPKAFIVDRQARVAWSGHPFRADEPLRAVLAGTYDIARQAELDKTWTLLGEDFSQAFRESRWQDAIGILDRMDVADPSSSARLVRLRIAIAGRQGDVAGAERIARDALSRKSDPWFAAELVGALLQAADPSRLDLDFVLTTARRAADDGTSTDARTLGALARAYMADGNPRAAIAIWRRMLEVCEPMVHRPGIEALIEDAEALEARRSRLEPPPLTS